MDPIADMLIQMKNASRAKAPSIIVPHSERKFKIALILKQKGFLENVERRTKKTGRHSFKNLELTLYYDAGEPILRDVRRISKLSRRVYAKKDEIFPVKNGRGVALISTSKGIMSDDEARKEKIGGEIIAEIW